jgi:hypothetical protein
VKSFRQCFGRAGQSSRRMTEPGWLRLIKFEKASGGGLVTLMNSGEACLPDRVDHAISQLAPTVVRVGVWHLSLPPSCSSNRKHILTSPLRPAHHNPTHLRTSLTPTERACKLQAVAKLGAVVLERCGWVARRAGYFRGCIRPLSFCCPVC